MTYVTALQRSGTQPYERYHEDCSRLSGQRGRNTGAPGPSDYHTRRALRIFTKEAPNHSFSIAAAYDPREFGVQWWRHREWSKTNLYEWMRLTWWELIDRWW
jgi:hypothetical protein